MMKQWLSPAKLNLFLYITGRRPDNYHNLQTLFQFIDLCDSLTFNLRKDNKINLLTPFDNVPYDKNLIVIAAQCLKNYTQRLDLGIDITINKKIPMGGGLGGASSNAATVLVALNELWQLALPIETLITLGRKLGADVPIFIYGHAAFAEGIGDQLQSVDYQENWYLITYPNIEISTVEIFNDPGLKRDTPVRTIEQLLSQPFEAFSNDCENIVGKRYPKVHQIISYLSQFAPTKLTGTGACVFSLCHSQQQAQEIQSTLNKFSVESFITRSLNTSPLYQ
ncbi:4-(cytidine 5'-diphospho)-2-C-methyl-D-erythritol kinase [Gilliamella sp. B2969]|uniref:4-(cytidine 5'-diphospho)-2-C-methyl-D-erythritol kinase n=1 Tax=Gilliamella sp. B2969 TaxID=2818021 RepID=UPI003A5CBB80